MGGLKVYRTRSQSCVLFTESERICGFIDSWRAVSLHSEEATVI